MVRKAIEADLPLVLTDWRKDYYEHALGFSKGMSETTFNHFHSILIKSILARSALLVACDPDEPSVVFGWICWEPGVLHFVMVKRKFRKCGIGSALLAATDLGTEFYFSHLTHLGNDVRFNSLNYKKTQYCPYAM